jgi:peptidoglycan/LPS O-acetylase OafA/YrhL
MTQLPKQGQATSARRYDLDWLRVLAILVVFVFHSGRFFDQGDWHVKNPTTYFGVQVWTTFLAHWLMPLIFVISGAGTFYALGTRGAGRFVKDRALRLLVPLVVGIFSHVMVQVYLERISHGQFRGSLLAFIPRYFDGMYAFGGNFAWMGLHLWYLEMLFVFSLLLLPLFSWLKHGGGQRAAGALAGWLARPLAIYLLALPIALLLVVLDPSSALGNRGFGGWSIVIYILFFAYGFVLPANDAARQAIARQRWLSLGLGIGLFLALAGLAVVWREPAFGTTRYTIIFALFGCSSWCWVLAILGFGAAHLNFSSPQLRYANEAVLPFYVMHQSALIYLGFFVVQWQLPDLAKWLIITPTSFVIIAALYELVVRRVNLLRLLFGMKPLPKESAPRTLGAPLGSTRS